MDGDYGHKSVLLQECLDALQIKPDGVYVDGTLGGGGHAEEILKRLSPKGRLLGIDRDEDALAAAKERLSAFPNLTLVRDNFRNLKEILKSLQMESVSGVVLDLGVSSYQFDTGERGFSYRFEDMPLDMRMDTRQALTAETIVNTYDEATLFLVLKRYGEEPFAKQIARSIVKEREKRPIRTTGQLNDLIRASVPEKYGARGAHPSKRAFQALRIEVNGELDALKETLADAIPLLRDGGRLCVITFHSLEDRLVKEAFASAEHPCTCPPGFPVCVCGKQPLGRTITKKGITPSAEETASNRRARSAKLRVFERRVSE